ncbi:MAG: hypothetical protein M1839_008575 [Geoglossum umbratile]|nr:MAG: hypothetical protein M1839_008575 [Geoglossum umbratile]
MTSPNPTIISSETATTTIAPKRTHTVDVGPASELVFKPNQLNATIGDIIQFDFWALNHTLTQSSFQNPCIDSGKFNTGFNQFNPQNISGKFLVHFEIVTESPQWFYCAQTVQISHCQAGMVFGLNTAGSMGQFLNNTVTAASLDTSGGTAQTGLASSMASVITSITLVAFAGASNTAFLNIGNTSAMLTASASFSNRQAFGTGTTAALRPLPTIFPLISNAIQISSADLKYVFGLCGFFLMVLT